MTTTTVMPAPAARLVRRYYMYGGLYTLAASIIWGVNTLFLLDAGLSISEVFIANAAWAAGTMIFEIPTGVVADTVGRRISFLLSLVVLAITTLVYVGLAQVGGGLVAFAVVSVLIGLGFTFYSGAMEAWLVDGLRFHGYDGELDRVFSRGQMVSGAAMLVGTVSGVGLVRSISPSRFWCVRGFFWCCWCWRSSECMIWVSSHVMSRYGRSPQRPQRSGVPGSDSAGIIARCGC